MEWRSPTSRNSAILPGPIWRSLPRSIFTHRWGVAGSGMASSSLDLCQPKGSRRPGQKNEHHQRGPVVLSSLREEGKGHAADAMPCVPLRCGKTASRSTSVAWRELGPRYFASQPIHICYRSATLSVYSYGLAGLLGLVGCLPGTVFGGFTTMSRTSHNVPRPSRPIKSDCYVKKRSAVYIRIREPRGDIKDGR